jgi:hypothetical protein
MSSRNLEKRASSSGKSLTKRSSASETTDRSLARRDSKTKTGASSRTLSRQNSGKELTRQGSRRQSSGKEEVAANPFASSTDQICVVACIRPILENESKTKKNELAKFVRDQNSIKVRMPAARLPCAGRHARHLTLIT